MSLAADEQRAQLVQFARRVYEVMRSWQTVHPYDTFKVESTLSRLLALVPEYDSGRVRIAKPVRGAAKMPSIATALDLADRLGAPICALFPSSDHASFSESELQQIARALRGLASKFSRSSRTNDFGEVERFEITSKKEFDFAAGLAGIEADFAPEPHDVFSGIRGIESEQLQVIRVTSDSMSPLLLPGDRVLIDTTRTRPREGDVVGVVSESHGRVVGYWHAEERRFFLKKENRDQQTIALGAPEDWRVVGTITSFVDAPLRPRDRLRR